MKIGQIWSSKDNININPHDIKLIKYLGHDRYSVEVRYPDWEDAHEGHMASFSGRDIFENYNLRSKE